MERNPFTPDFDELPETLPVFPLSGVLLLPTGNLPLNIFEPRYLDMVRDVLAVHRMIGMVQPRSNAKENAIYETGCAGKITEFEETADGRFLISLSGICRFRVAEELSAATRYRQVKVDWHPFRDDLYVARHLDLDRLRLHELLGPYFKAQELTCDWDRIDEATDRRLITCLSMICPFDPEEKQALLEAPCGKSRAKIFMTMLEIAVAGCNSGGCSGQH